MARILEKLSPCKVNLLLNILGRRPDGYHELETVMHPVAVHDRLVFERKGGGGIELVCAGADLPTGPGNLVYRAADMFLKAAKVEEGVRVRLEKRLPLAAGLGGGSANAAVTLKAMNELYGAPLSEETLTGLAAGLGSDVPFFLQSRPALATGRGECVEALDFFPALRGRALVLVHPGFGVSTAWAYQALGGYPEALNGRRGRGRELVEALRRGGPGVWEGLYNSLEAPVLEKYPILRLYQEFLRGEGALACRMSGSGSTTFAITESRSAAEEMVARFRSHFGESDWVAVVEFEGAG